MYNIIEEFYLCTGGKMREELTWGKQLWDLSDAKEMVDEFLKLYQKRPIHDNRGGMSSTHLFWTWYVLKKLNPKHIIESGVFKGQGTWLMRKTCPDANIYSIDPLLEQRTYIDEYVTYFTEDFSKIQWENYLNPNETFCFFDDHQDAYLRVQQMKWMGFSMAMFEDNYPAIQGDCYSLKKIFSQKEYVIDGAKKKYFSPNEAHLHFLKKNLDTYTTFPPFFRNSKTRWGDDWDDDNYSTPNAIMSDVEEEKYPILKGEASGYTWICYVKLKEKI